MGHRHSFFFLLAILLILNSETPLTGALPLSVVNGTTNGQLQTYIVQVEHPAEGNRALLTDEQQEDYYRSFLPNNTLDSGEPRLIYSYYELMSGFAARLTPEELTVMKSMDGFVHARPEEIYTLQTTYTYELLGLNSYGSSLWKESNHGEGVIVGVIDSGITPTHPSFADDGTMPLPPLKWRGGCGFKQSDLCNNKIIGAVSFIGGRSPEPYDDTGHGTHVAGIAVGVPVYDASVLGSARGTAIGMAPRAHLSVYKGCSNGGCSESDTMKCIEQAFRDGVDVINMSFASRQGTLEESGAQMTFVAMKRKDILSIAAAGNNGPRKSKISHSAPWFITVGAANTDRRVTSVVILGNGMEFEGQSAYQPNPSNLTSMLPIVYPGGVNKTQATLTCQRGSMQGFEVKGKLVLCGTGGKNDSRPEKGRVVEEAGGAAVVILSQPWEGYTTSSDPHYIPASQVSFVDSMKILNNLQTEGNPTGTIEFKGTNFGARPSPTVASRSSRGPSLINGGILKPDIIAPGVNILSASNKEVGPNPVGSTKTFTFRTGTSMAAPHVTGIAALLRKTHPGWSAAAIKSALMTTATRNDQDGKPFSDDAYLLSPASVFAVGAGFVNPPKANDPGLIYDIGPDDYISYLCGILTDFQVSFIALEKVVCSTRATINAEQLNYPSIMVSLGKSKTGKITVNRTVTNVGEADSEYTAHVKPPNGVSVTVNPTTLQFSSLDQKENFSIELTLTRAPPSPDDALEGEIVWVSSDNKYSVRSPIVVTA